MKRNHKDDNEIDLGGVEDLTEALDGVNAKTYRKPSDVDVPEPEVKDPTDDLDSHRTASEMDHPRGSVRMKHFDKQTRDAIQRVLESLAKGKAEDIALEDTAGRYTATDVEAALAEIAGAGRTTETVKGNADDITTLQALDIPGMMVMYGAAAAPAGWLLCDGASLLRATYADLFAVIGVTFGSVDGTHFNVPDMRGIFPRGTGTHGTLLNANGVAFAGTLGTYQNDKFQGHKHRWKGSPNALAGGPYCDIAQYNPTTTVNVDNQTTVADGTNGTPRAGVETNPANLGVNYIIKT